MVTLLLDATQLEVVLSSTERALAFRKEPLRIERAHITRVQLTSDAWTWLRGVRSTGTHVAGVVAMGTWASAGAKDFVLVRRKKPAVVIDLEGDAEFTRVVLTTRNGIELVQALRIEGVAEAQDVVSLATGTIPVVTPTKPKPKPKAAKPATKAAPALG